MHSLPMTRQQMTGEALMTPALLANDAEGK